ncbi:hypothetical protein [Dyadobacter luteus]|jgi:hypothetical protein|nr:hypothetical protein [Dyadobacter luteus]
MRRITLWDVDHVRPEDAVPVGRQYPDVEVAAPVEQVDVIK